MTKNKKRSKGVLYTKVALYFIVFVIAVFAFLFTPRIINNLRGNITSINAQNENVTTGVIISTNMVLNKKPNTIVLKIYNGSSNSIMIDGYIYRNFCVSGQTCDNYQKQYLVDDNGNRKVATISSDSDYELTINNASSLYSADAIDVGISYSIADGTLAGDYTISTYQMIFSSFDETLINSDETLPSNVTSSSLNITSKDTNVKGLKIELNKNLVSMDISENLSKSGLTYKITKDTDFTGSLVFEHPQSTKSTSSKIFGNDNSSNIKEYFNYTDDTSTLSDNGTFTLFGLATKTITNATITPGLYFTITKDSTIYSSDSADTFSGTLPSFTLNIYNKAILKTAIEAGYDKLYAADEENYDIDSLTDYKIILQNAVNLYKSRYIYTKTYYDTTKNAYSTKQVNVTQEEIQDVADALNNTSIRKKTAADYTALNTILTKAKAITREYYTDLTSLDSAITVADKAVSESLTSNYQTKIDNATSKLTTAYNALTLKDADWSGLKNAIDSANNYTNSTIYTDNSWTTFTNAKTAAVTVYNQKTLKIDKQEQVDEYTTTLNNAISGLVKKPADYTALNKLIQDYKYSTGYINGWYTDATKKPVDNYIAAIDYTKKIDEQSTVDGWYTALKNLIDSLKLRRALGYYKTDNYVPFDGAISLEEFFEKIKTYNLDEYTDMSKTAIQGFIDDEERLMSVDVITIDKQNDMDFYLSYVYDAINSFEKKPGNYTELCTVYQKAININKNYYDTSEVDKMYQAIWNINWNYKINEQDKIDAETEQLNSMLSSLVMKKADVTNLKEAYQKATSLDSTIYVNFSGVSAALKQYNSVATLNIDKQSKVDEVTDKINTEVKKLVIKDADYSKIEALKSKINQLDSSKYTNFGNVTTALNNIVYGKNITEQAKVDDMYNQLKDAYDGLLRNGEYLADYSALRTAVSRIPSDISGYSSAIQSEINSVLSDVKSLSRYLKSTEQAQIDELTSRVNNVLSKLDVGDISSNTSNAVIISYLKVNGKKVDISKTPFTYTVGYDVVEAKVDVGLSSSDSTSKVYGGSVLLSGDNEITIQVTTKTGKVYTYKLIVTRSATSDYLSDLSVKNNAITFSKSKQEYTIKVDQDTDKLDLSAIAEDDNASVKIIGNKNLKNGSKVTIEVTSLDGTVRVYTLNVQKSGSVDVKIIIGLFIVLIILAITLKIMQSKMAKKESKI